MIYHNKTKEELIQELKQIQEKQATLLVLLATNVVEHKLTLDTLKTSEARYHRLFKAVKERFLIQDPGIDVIKEVNPFLIDLFNYSKEEFDEKQIWERELLKDVAAN